MYWLVIYLYTYRKDVDLELMATPEQRAFMFENVCRIRNEKPIFVVDFGMMEVLVMDV